MRPLMRAVHGTYRLDGDQANNNSIAHSRARARSVAKNDPLVRSAHPSTTATHVRTRFGFFSDFPYACARLNFKSIIGIQHCALRHSASYLVRVQTCSITRACLVSISASAGVSFF